MLFVINKIASLNTVNSIKFEIFLLNLDLFVPEKFFLILVSFNYKTASNQ